MFLFITCNSDFVRVDFSLYFFICGLYTTLSVTAVAVTTATAAAAVIFVLLLLLKHHLFSTQAFLAFIFFNCCFNFFLMNGIPLYCYLDVWGNCCCSFSEGLFMIQKFFFYSLLSCCDVRFQTSLIIFFCWFFPSGYASTFASGLLSDMLGSFAIFCDGIALSVSPAK